MTYQPYPKMLYLDRGSYKVAHDEAEHEALLDAGYVEFKDLPEPNEDGLELLSDDQLREKLLAAAREVIWSRPRSEIIFQLRFQAEAAEVAKLKAQAPERAGEPSIYGSSSHPETVTINGRDLDIGPIIRSAFVDSGLSVANWNRLANNERDALIQLTIERLAEADPETVEGELTADGADPTPRQGPEPETVDTVVDDPLDHDADGEKGGAVEVSDEVESLRAELTALGVPFDGRWRAQRLRDALEAAKAA